MGQLRVAKVTGNAAKVQQIRGVRKSIACVMTVMSQSKKKALRKHYKNAKFLPTDLRKKKTRAMRRYLFYWFHAFLRALTKKEKSIKLEKTMKRLRNIPKHLFVAKKEKAAAKKN